MRRLRKIVRVLLLLILAEGVLLLILAGAARPAPAASPSFWHWQDEQNPKEDTIHYLTYEDMPRQEENP